MKKLAFICTGNTCRSPMAEAMMKKLLADAEINDIEVSSGGISVIFPQPASENAIIAAAEHGLNISGHSSRHMNEACDGADYIFGMTQAHCDVLRLAMPEKSDRILRLDRDKDITDPYGGTLDDYRAALAQIKAAEKKLLGRLFR